MLRLRGTALVRCHHRLNHSHPDAAWTASRLQTRSISIQQLDSNKNSRERIVILGSGWAGYTLARALDKRKFQVVVVSPRDYFAFTPLLASTSTGTLEFRTAIEPTRRILEQGSFLQGWADDVDLEAQTLTIEEAVDDPQQSRALTGARTGGEGFAGSKGPTFELKWDQLVVGVGCYAQTFNTKGVREHAFFLKDVGDARKIRNRILSCFEAAALPTTSEEMKRILLNFAVVGGGPTGIEFSAELHDIMNEDMKKLYPDLLQYAQVTVYDVAPQVLSMFDKSLSDYALKRFERQRIRVQTDHHVEELRLGVPEGIIEQKGRSGQPGVYTLKLKEEGEIGIGMCVWSTGLMMNPFVAEALNGKVKRDSKTGGMITNGRLQVKCPNDKVMKKVYGLGDCANMESAAYPATAQVASQKATWLAKRLNKGDIEKQTFTYKNLGVMAYVGDWNAILQGGGGQAISGRLAFFIWRSAYLVKSLSWRNRILIPMYWMINAVFGRDTSRF